ncbi:hypothetical protein [Pseudomonas sp. ACN8]|jgi:hypothetical protein|uniref:hypothetical protein n=1 Tax=Pseudomonas sp. ACN8 TaxID=1920428 RepID=UPI0015569940|nr:hypothetical protein [Pseudomonas sp. ACN8]
MARITLQFDQHEDRLAVTTETTVPIIAFTTGLAHPGMVANRLITLGDISWRINDF